MTCLLEFSGITLGSVPLVSVHIVPRQFSECPLGVGLDGLRTVSGILLPT